MRALGSAFERKFVPFLAATRGNWYSRVMRSRTSRAAWGKLGLLAVVMVGAFAGAPACAGGSACVWKVTGPKGKGTLLVGGSVHALRSIDYPLPAAYNRAFDAAERLVFEIDEKNLSHFEERLTKAGQYPRGESLRDHVAPRTYAYLHHLFGLMQIPEDHYSRCRPWFLVLMLWAPERRGLSEDLGVEGYLLGRARARKKPVDGLETAQEHIAVFSGLTDHQSETLLLLTLISDSRVSGEDDAEGMMAAWRRGDIATLARMPFHDFPAFRERLIDDRNRHWIPKMLGYLGSGRTYFAVVGAAHLGGPQGVLALLQAQGCTSVQL